EDVYAYVGRIYHTWCEDFHVYERWSSCVRVVIGFVYPEYDFASIQKRFASSCSGIASIFRLSRDFEAESRDYSFYRENVMRNREYFFYRENVIQNREYILFIARMLFRIARIFVLSRDFYPESRVFSFYRENVMRYR